MSDRSASKPGVPDAAMVAEACAQLSERGLFGIVWLDDQLMVTHKIGPLSGFVRIGETVSASILVLMGQEPRILTLRPDGGDVLNIPNVGFVGGDGAAPPRVNVSVSRYGSGGGFLVLLGRVLSEDVRDLVLEDEIRKRRIADAELQRINGRLEEFAYVISHDLKAPLRALRYLVGDVQDALSRKRVDAVGARQALEGVKGQVQRMSNMLVGLLEYSRIGREIDAVEAVDTAGLADEIIRSLRAPAGFVIRRDGEWPVLQTTLVPLDLVLRNLIENAVKHHDRPDGKVVVSAVLDNHALTINVTDDGAGIPSDWHEAIFQPFRRISDEPSADSSGIGLALVRRTIETAGGRIEVRSDPALQRGSEFIVRWPRHIVK